MTQYVYKFAGLGLLSAVTGIVIGLSRPRLPALPQLAFNRP